LTIDYLADAKVILMGAALVAIGVGLDGFTRRK
jgi:hypothetical protein